MSSRRGARCGLLALRGTPCLRLLMGPYRVLYVGRVLSIRDDFDTLSSARLESRKHGLINTLRQLENSGFCRAGLAGLTERQEVALLLREQGNPGDCDSDTHTTTHLFAKFHARDGCVGNGVDAGAVVELKLFSIASIE